MAVSSWLSSYISHKISDDVNCPCPNLSWYTSVHDDVIKWKHFPCYWPFVRGIHWSPFNSPHRGQRCGALMLTLICARINHWVNNCEAGDLRRHRAHYDVIALEMGPLALVLHTAPRPQRQRFLVIYVQRKCSDAILMMTSLNGNIFRVTGPLCGEFTGPGEFPTQRPVTRSFDVFFDRRLNKPLSKQSWGWWFETLSRSLWRHRYVNCILRNESCCDLIEISLKCVPSIPVGNMPALVQTVANMFYYGGNCPHWRIIITGFSISMLSNNWKKFNLLLINEWAPFHNIVI